MKASASLPLRLLWIWTFVGLAGFAWPFFRFYLPKEGILDVNGNIIGDDFVNAWCGAKLVLMGKIGLLYSPQEYFHEMIALIGERIHAHNFSYLPNILPIILVFGLLPYFPALLLWTVSGLSCLAVALRKNGFVRLGLQGGLLAILSPASVLNAVHGQNGAFTAALFLGGLCLSETSPIIAGVLFGLLTVKPHLGLLIPVVLVVRRNWKCFTSATLTSLALASVSVAFWGVVPWQDYMSKTLTFQVGFLSDTVLSSRNMLMPGLYADLTTVLGMSEHYAVMLWMLVALPSAFITLRVIAREGLTPRAILMLAIATILILPYGFDYDMVLIAGAIVIYAGSHNEISTRRHMILGLLWALPGMLIVMKLLPVPFSSAVLIGALLSLYFPSRHSGVPASSSVKPS